MIVSQGFLRVSEEGDFWTNLMKQSSISDCNLLFVPSFFSLFIFFVSLFLVLFTSLFCFPLHFFYFPLYFPLYLFLVCWNLLESSEDGDVFLLSCCLVNSPLLPFRFFLCCAPLSCLCSVALTHPTVPIMRRCNFVLVCVGGKVMAALLVDLLKEDLNEELYMAREAGLGLNLYLTKVWKPPE